MCCGRCRSTDLDREPDAIRCRECGALLRARPAAWLPTMLIIAAVFALPASPWILAPALPALVAAVIWGESLRPVGDPVAPPPLPVARLR